eukprot:SAG11_NODE_4242_length_1991_cov_3.034884_4_plen_74_part_00
MRESVQSLRFSSGTMLHALRFEARDAVAHVQRLAACQRGTPTGPYKHVNCQHSPPFLIYSALRAELYTYYTTV